MMIKLNLILLVTVAVCVSAEVTVKLHHGGSVLGEKKSINLRESYFSFKGIPYALPPLKELRFKPPVPHPGWDGTRNATSHGPVCVSPGYIISSGAFQGQEDCLYLNVYSPNLTPDEKLPVMFWIHGGSFTAGSGNSLIYGPEWLVKQDVVVVTINYRLGLLGFFSTGDRNAPGNYGAKDVVEALKWVQSNIESFGGDRNKVTVFGESAGSALTHYLVLSKMSSGLFAQAIAQSGTALSPWAFQDYPRTKAFQVARQLNITATTTEEIVKQLREFDDLEAICNITPGLLTLELPRGNTAFTFAPVVETEDSDEPRFLVEPPLTTIKKGTFNDVPFILGQNSQEALYSVREIDLFPDTLDKYNNNTQWLLPYEWHIEPNTDAADDIIYNVLDMYFGGGPIKNKVDYANFNTDRHFTYGLAKTVELHSAKQKSPVYYYIFSFDGVMNYIKKIFLVIGYNGAMHADELGYLWKMMHAPAPILPGSKSDITRSRMIRMWTDFAKYGNPTPKIDELITTQWANVVGRQEYLDIGENLVAGKEPFYERVEMWKQLDRKYN
uniref:Carboxylic ester hydrolase n=1 Tax=Culicoides sonorensis TaxID=179676 RepID=A0A336MTX0_CULSO